MDTLKSLFLNTVMIVLRSIIKLHLIIALVDYLILHILDNLGFYFFIFAIIFADIFAN